MTLRGLARGSVLYSIGFVLPRIGTFLLLPIYVNFLSAADFGAISLVVSVASLLAVVLRMGLDGALMRLYFDAGDAAARDRLIGTVATLTAAASIAGGLVALILSWAFFSALFVGLPFLPFGAMAAVLSFTVTFQYLPATVLRAREQPGRFLAFTGGTFVITAATTLVLVAMLELGATGALLGQLAGGIFVVAVSVVIMARAGGPRVDRRVARAALRFGLPLVPHGLSGWVLNVSDRWLLGFLLPLPALAARSAIGVYSLAYQLAYAVDLLAQSFNAAWVPFFYRYGSTAQGPRIHREMTAIVMAAFGAIAAILALNAEVVVTVIASPAFTEASEVMPILAVGFVAHVAYIAIVTVIFHARRTGVLPLITGASALVNVLLNLGLIPSLGILGAGWATLGAFSFMSVATYVAARRAYRIDLDAPRLSASVTIVVAAAAYALLREEAIDAARIGRDLLLSAGIAGLAASLSVGPARSLRTLTRAAARELRGSDMEPITD